MASSKEKVISPLALFLSKQGWTLLVLSLLIALVSAGVTYTNKFNGLNWFFYDLSMRYSQLPEADEIVVIDIDNKSLEALGRWPWPRSTHGELLEHLKGAQVVVFDILFPDLDRTQPASDVAFAKAMKQHGSVVLPIYIETLGQQGQVIENPPHELFYREAKAIGHVHLSAEEDGVIRSVFLTEGVGSAYWPHLSLAVNSFLDPANKDLLVGERAGAQALLQTVGIARDYFNLLPMPSIKQGLRHYSYIDVLSKKVDQTAFDDKVVFVGATAAGLGDTLTTPIGTMNGVELNAWIFHALGEGLLIQALTTETLAILTFVLVLLILLFLGRLSPRQYLVASIISVFLFIMVSASVLPWLRLWIPPVSFMLGLVLFLPLWSWLRAESMLRFLQQEIAELSEHDSRHDVAHASWGEGLGPKSKQFLARTGMLDSQTQQLSRQAGIAGQALSYGVMNTDFWQSVYAENQLSQTLQSRKQGVDIIARTITQLNRIKARDQQYRHLIEQSLSSLQDAVCIADLFGQIRFKNKHIQDWFGELAFTDSLLDSLAQVQLRSGQNWEQVFQDLFTRNQTFTGEASLDHPTIKAVLCQISLVSINTQFIDTLIISFTDITELKIAEKARSEALSFLSHDLRSPMVSVLAILDKVQNQTKPDRSSASMQDDNFTAIRSLVKKNLDYAESFLQLSKADALPSSALIPCDLHAVLDGAQTQAFALAASKSIEIKTERCKQDVWILGEMSLVERAMTNLISNAIKFSPEGACVTLRLEKTLNQASLSVEDHGMGISDEDQKRIFERFTRIPATRETHGAGLGLNFVATVARKHQGRVVVHSELGKGARFTLCFPALEESEVFSQGM